MPYSSTKPLTVEKVCHVVDQIYAAQNLDRVHLNDVSDVFSLNVGVT